MHMCDPGPVAGRNDGLVRSKFAHACFSLLLDQYLCHGNRSDHAGNGISEAQTEVRSPGKESESECPQEEERE